MTARFWFLDVDGVIAPFGKGGAFTDWVRSPHPEYELWLSPTQADLIRRTLERTGTELVWVTTWAHDASTYIEDVFGWRTHRFAPLPHPDIKGADLDPATGRWWKLDAVQRFLEELQPDRFVWSDDDLDQHRSAVRQALTGLGSSGLLQSPRPNVGLTRTLLREAEEHLSAGHVGSSGAGSPGPRRPDGRQGREGGQADV